MGSGGPAFARLCPIKGLTHSGHAFLSETITCPPKGQTPLGTEPRFRDADRSQTSKVLPNRRINDEPIEW